MPHPSADIPSWELTAGFHGLQDTSSRLHVNLVLERTLFTREEFCISDKLKITASGENIICLVLRVTKWLPSFKQWTAEKIIGN